MFMLRMKVGGIAGIVLASPVWILQIWGFITPGLLKNERRWTFIFVSIAVTLFVAGAVMAYFVIAYGLDFLLQIGDETQTVALSGERYFNFLLGLIVVFGVSFEVPLLISMLNIVGVLEYETIKDKRRVIILILFVFAAFMTPGQDPMSMIALAFALCILVELALQFCRINDKRRDRKRPDWLNQDDDHASALDLGPGGVDGPAPVALATPVQPTPQSMVRSNEHLGDLSARPGSAFDDVL